MLTMIRFAVVLLIFAASSSVKAQTIEAVNRGYHVFSSDVAPAYALQIFGAGWDKPILTISTENGGIITVDPDVAADDAARQVIDRLLPHLRQAMRRECK